MVLAPCCLPGRALKSIAFASPAAAAISIPALYASADPFAAWTEGAPPSSSPPPPDADKPARDFPRCGPSR